MKILLIPARWYLTRKADKIEAEFRFGPYLPGTYAAEMLRLAGNIRKFADSILPSAPKDPRTGGP